MENLFSSLELTEIRKKSHDPKTKRKRKEVGLLFSFISPAWYSLVTEHFGCSYDS